jgi:hypothetical protein
MDDNIVDLDGVLVDVHIKVAKNKKKKKLLNKNTTRRKKYCSNERGFFWNCRGLRDLAKHTFLHDVSEG